MGYPDTAELQRLADSLRLSVQRTHEWGAAGIAEPLARANRALKRALREIDGLKPDPALARREPDGLQQIRKLRPPGPRRLLRRPAGTLYRERLEGALLGRFAGCTLGAPVEFWSVERMESWAAEIDHPFPPTSYWPRIPEPQVLRYSLSRRDAYTAERMHGVPVDDDIAYTLLGLLVLEDYGPRFTTEQVAQAWLRYLPYACTAEKAALENLRSGVSAARAAEKNNPYTQWIGAAIRADPWGYVAAGWPEQAAALAWRDAVLTHRRNGVYAEMYFAAVIAAAFAVDDPVEALTVGLTEIPRECSLARAVRWALRRAPHIRDYREARGEVDRKFRGMSRVHAINNACLTVWGVCMGGGALTPTIAQTVAMGMDNDCTAATAGSIVGATAGKSGIPEHWYARFENTVHSYLIGHRRFAITALVRRFARQASRVRRILGEDAPSGDAPSKAETARAEPPSPRRERRKGEQTK